MGTPGDPVSYALEMVGKPYEWDRPIDPAQHNPPHADCSGLVMWACYQAGLRPILIHQTALMYAQMKKNHTLVPFSQRQRNDFLWYNDGGIIHHVALIIDDTTLVEAPTPGVAIRTRDYSGDSGIMAHVGRLSGATTVGSTGGSGADPASAMSRFHYLPPGSAKGVDSSGAAKSWPAWYASSSDKTPSGKAFYPHYDLSKASNSDVKMMHDYLGLLNAKGGIAFNGGVGEINDGKDRTQSGAHFRALTKSAGGENEALSTWTFYNQTLHDYGPGGGEVKSGLSPAIDAVTSLAGFLSMLTSAAFWERAALFVAGGALLIVGVNAANKSRKA